MSTVVSWAARLMRFEDITVGRVSRFSNEIFIICLYKFLELSALSLKYSIHNGTRAVNKLLLMILKSNRYN